VELADLVTEMKEVKHPYTKGILAQRGIDYCVYGRFGAKAPAAHPSKIDHRKLITV
jgi:ATP:corrinoid adenosyltransferase BtuR/CobO/CobP